MLQADICFSRPCWTEVETSMAGSTSAPRPVEAIRCQFREIAASRSDDPLRIRAEDIARYWLQKVPGLVPSRVRCDSCDEQVECESRARLGVGVGLQQKQAIALRVAQVMQDIGSSRTRGLDMEQWIHHVLVAESGVPSAALAKELAKAVRKNERYLQDTQNMFWLADLAQSGKLGFNEIAEACRNRLWNIIPAASGPVMNLSHEELQFVDPEKAARTMIEAMDFNDDGRVSYPEFMAYSLGRRKHEVLLHMYDLSNNGAKSISPWLLGKQIDGVWHTGVVAFGKEYYYSKDTVFTNAGETVFGKPHRVLHVGHTFWRQDELHQHITCELKPIFQRDTYDVICNNCNTFSDAVLMFLVGNHVPDEVMKQPELLLQAQSIRLIRPLLNWWLRDRIVVREDQKITSSASRLKPEDQVPPGSVVSIHPERGFGEPTLGQVTTAQAAELEQLTASGSLSGDSPATRAAVPLTSQRSGDDNFCSARAVGCSSWWSFTCGAMQTATSGTGASSDRLWVQYFDVSLSPATLRPKVRIEHIPRSRLSLGGLRADGQAIFNRVMKTLVDGEAEKLNEDPLNNRW